MQIRVLGGNFSSQDFSLSQRPLLAAPVLPPSKSLDTSDLDKTFPYLLSHKSGGLRYGAQCKIYSICKEEELVVWVQEKFRRDVQR